MERPQPRVDHAPEERRTARMARRFRYWPLLLLPVVALFGWFGSQPLTVTLIYGATWATYAVGYDMFSGFSGRVNLGYAMFPATAAYTSAALSARLGIPLVLSVPAGVGVSLLLAAA